MNSKFEYNLAKDHQIQSLRKQNTQLYEQNISLKKSLQELIKVNSQLTQSIEQFNNVNTNINTKYQNGSSRNLKQNIQSVQDMQNKIDMLTMEIEMLRKDIGGNPNSNVYSHQSNGTNQNDQQMMIMIQELLQSFKIMQNKYQNQISDLYEEINNYKMQWESMIAAITNKSTEKLQEFIQIVAYIKNKRQIINHIQKKIKTLEYNNDSMDSHSQKEPSNKVIEQIKSSYERQIQQKNKTIKLYMDLVSKLRKKITEKV